MNFQLTDYQTTMMDLKRRLDVHLRDYQEINGVLDEWQQIQKLYDTKLQAAKPEVMVYGIYNAGKSSIINELLGEDRARVSDIPTTDSVDYIMIGVGIDWLIPRGSGLLLRIRKSPRNI